MNRITADRLRSAAVFLSTPIAQQSRLYLANPYQLALNLIDCLKEGDSDWVTAVDLSTRMRNRFKRSLDRETVVQVLRALKEGGMAIESGNKGWRIQCRSDRKNGQES